MKKKYNALLAKVHPCILCQCCFRPLSGQCHQKSNKGHFKSLYNVETLKMRSGSQKSNYFFPMY